MVPYTVYKQMIIINIKNAIKNDYSGTLKV